MKPWLYTIVRNRALNAKRDTRAARARSTRRSTACARRRDVVLEQRRARARRRRRRRAARGSARGARAQRARGSHARPDRRGARHEPRLCATADPPSSRIVCATASAASAAAAGLGFWPSRRRRGAGRRPRRRARWRAVGAGSMLAKARRRWSPSAPPRLGGGIGARAVGRRRPSATTGAESETWRNAAGRRTASAGRRRASSGQFRHRRLRRLRPRTMAPGLQRRQARERPGLDDDSEGSGRGRASDDRSEAADDSSGPRTRAARRIRAGPVRLGLGFRQLGLVGVGIRLERLGRPARLRLRLGLRLKRLLRLERLRVRARPARRLVGLGIRFERLRLFRFRLVGLGVERLRLFRLRLRGA